MLLNADIKRGRNLTDRVKNCLCQLGFGYDWLNGGVGDEKRFLSAVKQRLKDWYLQEWYTKNTNNDRFGWFSFIKQNFGLEKYLNVIDITKFRDFFIPFRFGINELRVNDHY